MSSGKKYVIITCSDARDGDFLAEHWLRSLTTNVNMEEIDVAILDYGLTEEQRRKLREVWPVNILPSTRDGHVVIIRFRDIANFLKGTTYEQVMTCDGGDIIFQRDINELFKQDRDKLKAVCEDYWLPFDDVMIYKKSIAEGVFKEIREYYTLRNKMINAGMLVGPRQAFIELSDFCYGSITDKSIFGPDQVVINYFLYKHGFKELDDKYNFIFYTVQNPFTIENGVFLDKNEDVIPIVHNAGRYSFLRAVQNFGFGPERNTIDPVKFSMVRLIIKLGSVLRTGHITTEALISKLNS